MFDREGSSTSKTVVKANFGNFVVGYAKIRPLAKAICCFLIEGGGGGREEKFF